MRQQQHWAAVGTSWRGSELGVERSGAEWRWTACGLSTLQGLSPGPTAWLGPSLQPHVVAAAW